MVLKKRDPVKQLQKIQLLKIRNIEQFKKALAGLGYEKNHEASIDSLIDKTEDPIFGRINIVLKKIKARGPQNDLTSIKELLQKAESPSRDIYHLGKKTKEWYEAKCKNKSYIDNKNEIEKNNDIIAKREGHKKNAQKARKMFHDCLRKKTLQLSIDLEELLPEDLFNEKERKAEYGDNLLYQIVDPSEIEKSLMVNVIKPENWPEKLANVKILISELKEIDLKMQKANDDYLCYDKEICNVKHLLSEQEIKNKNILIEAQKQRYVYLFLKTEMLWKKIMDQQPEALKRKNASKIAKQEEANKKKEVIRTKIKTHLESQQFQVAKQLIKLRKKAKQQAAQDMSKQDEAKNSEKKAALDEKNKEKKKRTPENFSYWRNFIDNVAFDIKKCTETFHSIKSFLQGYFFP
jgi:hypothetical protein